MRKNILLVPIFVVVAAVFVFAIPAFASARTYQSGDYYYEVEPDGTAAIVDYDGEGEPLADFDSSGNPTTNCEEVNIAVPRKIDGYAVTRIDPSAFKGTAFNTMTLPKTLKTISSAYDGEEHGFEYRSCREGVKAFRVEDGNESLVAVDGVVYTSDMAMAVCYPMRSDADSYQIPDGVKGLADGFFSSESPHLLLEAITLPASFERLNGSQLSFGTFLESVDVTAGNSHFKSVDGIVYSADGSELVYYPSGRAVSHFDIPVNVQAIREKAISNVCFLESAFIPTSVITIGEDNFTSCPNLELISVDDANEHFRIADRALISSDSMVLLAYPAGVMDAGLSCVIPAPVKVLGKNAFRDCYVETIEIPSTVKEFHEGALATKYVAHTRVLVAAEKQLGTLRKDADDGNVMSSSAETSLKENVTGIIEAKYDGPIEVNKTIEVKAAAGKAKFTILTYKNNEAGTLAPKAWNGSGYVGTVRLESYKTGRDKKAHVKELLLEVGTFSVVEVAPKAFKNRNNVAILTLENVIKLGKSSFQGCTKLKKANLGASLKSIGSKCFMGCKSLKTVTVPSKKLKANKVGSSAFKKTPKKMTVKAPKSKLKTYKKAFQKAGTSKKAKYKKL